MATVAADRIRPFRWDLTRPDQLGTLLEGSPSPDLWFRDALAQCAARVLARSGGGDLVFVGRSGDSLYDLLTGVLDGAGYEGRLHRFPFSCRWGWERLAPGDVARARDVLAASGVTPATLTTRRPVAFVDLVCSGGTFGSVYALVRRWADEERVQWDVARRKLRFTGVTSRERPDPRTWRWEQHAPWTRELRPGAVRNVSLDDDVWSYLGEDQCKLTPRFAVDTRDDLRGPRHDDESRAALAEALAIVAYGRSAAGRRAFVRALVREPTLADPWLRTLVPRITHPRAARRRDARATPRRGRH